MLVAPRCIQCAVQLQFTDLAESYLLVASMHIICRGAKMNVPFIHKCFDDDDNVEKINSGK